MEKDSAVGERLVGLANLLQDDGDGFRVEEEAFLAFVMNQRMREWYVRGVFSDSFGNRPGE